MSKFEHGSPWPAFDRTLAKDSVKKKEERKGTYKVVAVAMGVVIHCC